MTEKTRIKFVIFQNVVTALFVDMEECNNCILSYQFIGQHGAAHKSLKRYKRATVEQYNDLKCELDAIGYNLEVV